ncbi:MAG: hypothetical protein ACLRQT_10470 [Alistipes sp.]
MKFAHTIFAMPFAAVGFVYAYATLPAGRRRRAWLTRACRSCSAWSSPAIRPWASTAGPTVASSRESPHRGRAKSPPA